MLIRLLGVEVEVGSGAIFVSVSGLGEMWVEAHSLVRGRQWADYAVEDGDLTVHLGRTFIVFSPPCPVPLMGVA